jgi:hypothetical protein
MFLQTEAESGKRAVLRRGEGFTRESPPRRVQQAGAKRRIEWAQTAPRSAGESFRRLVVLFVVLAAETRAAPPPATAIDVLLYRTLLRGLTPFIFDLRTGGK